VIHWLVQSLDDCPDVVNSSAAPAWLSEIERAQYGTLKVEKRRRDWLLGRWTAKNLVRQYLATAGEEIHLDAVVIQADADGAPYARGDALGRLPVSLSISHSNGTAFCGLVAVVSTTSPLAPRPSLGCDIELVEPREASFVRDFFTAEEMAAVTAAGLAQDRLVTAIWSGKEAVLKAIREGLRTDTRRIVCGFADVAAPQPDWMPMSVRVDDGLAAQFPGRWSGWWHEADQFVLTMALLE
jgi:4'-phosphopantetheinyl transferase